MEDNRLQLAYNQDSHPVFNKICFWLITVDILFLPYLSFMAVSASVLIVALWVLFNYNKIVHDREGSFFIIMLFLMFFGTIMCLLYTGPVRLETTFGTAVKRFFQYALCFGTYFFYKDYFGKHEVNIKKIILFTIIYMAIFALLYQLFPREYATFKIAINPADNHTVRYLANSVNYRFNYLWTDPNNISYLVAGIAAWFLLQKDISNIQKLFVLVISTYIAFCTVSNGGLIILLLMCFIVFFRSLVNALKNGIKVRTFFFVWSVIIVIFIVIKATNILDSINLKYFSVFIERLGQYSSSSTGGRLEDLLYSFRFLNPIMLIMGTGNEGFSYEIGHIYWIGMYGVPAYIIFMWLMFRKTPKQKWSQYIWIIPFFVGFTMNVAIGEYKWMAIYLMLLAYSRVSATVQENTYEDEMMN